MDGDVRHAIGCMTGTSMDGVDGVLVRAEGRGVALRVRVVGSASTPMGALGAPLRDLASGSVCSAEEVARLAMDIGELCADLAAGLASTHGARPDLCALAGQTVFHRAPYSLQLCNPWPAAQRLGCRVVHDLRGADLAAGGQGAPITPAADWVLFRSDERSRVIVNLGGFCNATLLPAGCGLEAVRGCDVCACNQVLDHAARVALGLAYDEGGAHAGRGTADGGAGSALRAILEAQASGGRSLGSGDEAAAWVGDWSARLTGEDLCATAAQAVGSCIGERVRAMSEDAEVVLAGGGVHNAALAGAIERSAGTVRTSYELGVGVHEREAAAVAVLGLLAMDGVVFTLPRVTGRTEELRCEGSWIGVTP